ncbi:MAG: cytochrome b/b6 domain-containing protein [Pseudomonadota bacterium]|nr:cytochrome b/b6 domain-containing protein [Pseudomonadota bacterium]
MPLRKIMVFYRFERFWHWCQVLLILTLLFSGFEIHGFYSVLGFGAAVTVHTWAAFTLIVLWIFATFWLLATDAWKHYIPTTRGLLKVARYYAYGIFLGEHHPYKKTYQRKHNPLQALTYLILKVVIFPVVWMSGIAYLLYGFWGDSTTTGDLLTIIALLHTAAAFAVAVFIIVHLYLLSAGESVIDHIKPMLTGFDDVELTEEEEAFLLADAPRQIKTEAGS